MRIGRFLIEMKDRDGIVKDDLDWEVTCPAENWDAPKMFHSSAQAISFVLDLVAWEKAGADPLTRPTQYHQKYQ